MRKIRNSILVLYLFSFSVFSQESDLQVWSSVSLNYKASKKVNLYLKQGIRFRENSSLLSKSYTDLKIKYKYSKRISLLIGLRDIHEWNQELERDHVFRYYSDLVVKKKINRFWFASRKRFQRQGNYNEFANTFRQQLLLNYNIRKTKLEPEFAFEYFLRDLQMINKIRYTLGLSYPIFKNTDFNFSYRIQKELQVEDPHTLFILLAKLSYDI